MISTKLARDFAADSGRPRRVGDALVIGGSRFTIVGLYETGSLLLDNTIVMDIHTARRLLQLDDKTVSCFLVEPGDPASTETIAAQVESRVPGVDARTMAEFRSVLGRAIGQGDELLLWMVGLALLAGAVGTLNTMVMSTTERIAEFGILRANGWSRGDVLRLVLFESISLGLVAGAIGCLDSLILGLVANHFLDHGLRLSLTPRHWQMGLEMAAALGALGGLYPAWRASRLRPMEAIRRGSR